MNIVVISDTHIGEKNANCWKEAFETAFDLASKEGKIVIHCGDWFHSGSTVTPKLLNELHFFLLKMIEKYDVKLYGIYGNHDIPLLNHRGITEEDITLNSPLYLPLLNTPFKVYSNYYYKSFINKLNFLFLSYSTPENLTKYITDFINSNEDVSNTILVTHTSFNNDILPSGIPEENGVDKEIVRKFKLVLNGHIHTGKNDGNIITIGAPYQMKFGDSNGNLVIVKLD